MTEKKIVDMKSTAKGPGPEAKKTFKPSPENKQKAGNFRMIALVLWAVAIGLEIFAISRLNLTPIPIGLIIGLLVAMAVLSISGSMLWQKANRLDPASEKNKFKFFVQNQLGLIIAIIAFLPLIVLLLMNEDLEGKDKGIVTGIAIVALLVAGFIGWDRNPVSIEQYTQQTHLVEQLMGEDNVYWTKYGSRYHLFEDCQHINRKDTEEIYNGHVADAYEHKNIKEMCKTCENRARKIAEEEGRHIEEFNSEDEDLENNLEDEIEEDDAA